MNRRINEQESHATHWSGAVDRSGLSVGLTAGLLLFAAFALLFRNLGLYPVVFADEWVYSSHARHFSLSDAKLPSYLYFWIYRLTNICGDGFLECARVLNVVFFVGAIPFVYLVSRRYAGRWPAAVVCLVAVLAPMNTYTAYFMPEAMFFFGFWLLTWAALASDLVNKARWYGIALGSAIGLLSLVKVHGLFLAPGVLLFVVYVAVREFAATWGQALAIGASFVIGLLVVRLGGGVLAAGSSGLSLFGSVYGPIADSAAMGGERMSAIIMGGLESAGGHIIGLLALFALPVATVLGCLPRAVVERSESALDRLYAFLLLTLVPLVAVAALFTAAVAGAGPYESLTRLHARYYNFIFPLLIVVVAAQLGTRSPSVSVRWRALIAVVCGSGAMTGWYVLGTKFQPSFIDSPELRAFVLSPVLHATALGANLVCLVAWIWRPRFAAQLFLFAVALVVTAASLYLVSVEMRNRMTPDNFDYAGLHMRHHMSEGQRRTAVLVGTELAALFRARFMSDDPDVEMLQLARGATLTPEQLPPERSLAVIVGDVSASGFAADRAYGGFRVVSSTDKISISFRRGERSGELLRATGLSEAEQWGTWSIGSRVLLEFVNPLPENVEITLKASAFGPNVGAEFVARLGAEWKSFRVSAGPTTVKLSFSNPMRLRQIEFEVPNPVSPRSLGLNQDEREIGLGLQEMQIVPRATKMR